MICIYVGYDFAKVCEFTTNNLIKAPIICNVFIKYISTFMKIDLWNIEKRPEVAGRFIEKTL